MGLRALPAAAHGRAGLADHRLVDVRRTRARTRARGRLRSDPAGRRRHRICSEHLARSERCPALRGIALVPDAVQERPAAPAGRPGAGAPSPAALVDPRGRWRHDRALPRACAGARHRRSRDLPRAARRPRADRRVPAGEHRGAADALRQCSDGTGRGDGLRHPGGLDDGGRHPRTGRRRGRGPSRAPLRPAGVHGRPRAPAHRSRKGERAGRRRPCPRRAEPQLAGAGCEDLGHPRGCASNTPHPRNPRRPAPPRTDPPPGVSRSRTGPRAARPGAPRTPA